MGKGVVIKAFDLGVASMRQNEKAILTCAPEYAYGESGSPPNIPPNATLMFEVCVRIYTVAKWRFIKFGRISNTFLYFLIFFWLIIQIELFGWKHEDLSPQSNGAILRTIVKRASSRSTPSDGATVTGNFHGGNGLT